jgi:hypothetical protein
MRRQASVWAVRLAPKTVGFWLQRVLPCLKAISRLSVMGEGVGKPVGSVDHGTDKEDHPVTREALVSPSSG